MEHVLDNPVWNALISGNKLLCYGSGQVKYFDKDVSPFAGFDEISNEKFDLLHDLLPYKRPALIVSPMEIIVPGNWKILAVVTGLQMVHNAESNVGAVNITPVPLTHEHAPEMLSLAKLTNPGPFELNTIAFGHYYGIFNEVKLAAMAGQRMHVFNYAEVSAVCTHPDYTGKGYARQLLIHQINRIRAASNIPFLHVRNDNERAIALYKSMGFVTRKEIHFYAIVKAE